MVYTRKDTKGLVHDSFGSNLTATKKEKKKSNNKHIRRKLKAACFDF